MSDDSMGSILEFTENLKDAEAPKALGNIDVPGEITGATSGLSKSSGRKQVDVVFRIKPEDFPVDYEDAASFADGKTVHFYLSGMDDKVSRFRMRKFCESIGAKLGAKIDVNDWIGKSAMLSLGADEFEGVDRERILRVSSL
ncbi:MAG: hypothetical protein KKH61_21285 [Gammaproteobacteria bacterium]|uniref:Uncharacterized protein n=2 Tax=viral metagenome TaxID=1070528 RepID=A0A6H1ZB04_9ZZZZ|nr:hypothetical protein [Gammaproteobacteria bacterium]